MLENQQIAEIPVHVQLEELENFENVNISGNQFKNIPRQFETTRTLRKLDCSNNQISVTDNVSNNSTAELEEESEFFKPKVENKFVLDNPEDSIFNDEDDVEEFKIEQSSIIKSTSLDSGIQIIDTSFDFTRLENLTHLDLSSNKLESLPKSFFMLTNIEHLDISNNMVTALHTEFKSAPKLRYLNVSWNLLLDLPSWVHQLVRCAKFFISGNPFGDSLQFPDRFGRVCRRLKYVEMQNIGMTSLPAPLVNLLDLRHLTLANKEEKSQHLQKSSCVPRYFEGGEKSCNNIVKSTRKNHIWSLPDTIVNLVGLVKLNLRGVGLVHLPDHLAGLRSLQILDVSHNNLCWLPDSIAQVAKLELLNLSHNSLIMLPLDVVKLDQLAHLLAAFNAITEVPEQLAQLTSLETLDLYSNQISRLPASAPAPARLARLDLAANKVGLARVAAVCQGWERGPYPHLQRALRSWSGDWRLAAREDCTVDTRLFRDRVDIQDRGESEPSEEEDGEASPDEWFQYRNDDKHDYTLFSDMDKLASDTVDGEEDKEIENVEQNDETNEGCENIILEDESDEEDSWSVDLGVREGEPYGKVSKVDYRFVNIQNIMTNL